ncbi:SDR family NAD(P)-dependent oxidoreductase [Sphingomonas aracearum]|uniref:SDR family NAD(P)-dependent oxidoreductase n=1 Tax=Sphingomonas aracearum TaxID=2283317 RepID=A0A369W0H9_9SPHN|nr:SDR family oxidoreductase [Sphingomonas aracearum]RDE07549.1 SDR family NAD(P)-dependent oxidoreductase [Sphingomonas aracearum]
MGNRLEGKVALVLGAGTLGSEGGLSNGAAVALNFARQGAKVVAADLRLDLAEATSAAIRAEGFSSIAAQADASNSADVKQLIDRALAEYGRIDIHHNNVGIEQLGGPVETEEDAWDRVHAVNVKSVFLTCKHVIPVMEKQGGGSIINVSSTASIRWSGTPFLAYNSSKAAVNQVTRIVARQYAHKQIRCNAIIPGYMDTPHIRTLWRDLSPAEFEAKMAERNAKCPMGRQGTSQDVANAAVFLASDESSYITGNLLVVDGGWTI